jgi:hypothetical protein
MIPIYFMKVWQHSCLKYIPSVTSVIPLEENAEQFCKSMLGVFSQHDLAMSVPEVLMNLSMNLTTCGRMVSMLLNTFSCLNLES